MKSSFSTKTNKSLEGFQLSDLSKWGAYSEEKMYSSKIINEIVQFAKVRGVRVLPEIDTPGHVHSGWGGFERDNPSLGNLLLCREPDECSTPPCGQVIPDNPYYGINSIKCKNIFIYHSNMFYSNLFSAEHCKCE